MATTRKSAARKPAAVRPIRDTPADITFNADTYEREQGPDKPYVVVIGGRPLTFVDPQEIPWQDLMDLDDPETFAGTTLEDEDDRKHFLETPLKTGVMLEVMRRYREHYGLGNQGNVGA